MRSNGKCRLTKQTGHLTLFTTFFAKLFTWSIAALIPGAELRAQAAGPLPALAENWQFTRQVKDADFGKIPEGCTSFQLNKDHGIDLDQVNGVPGKRDDECIVYNEFTLDRKQRLGFSAGADWWMDVYLNGKKVFSTFPDGNSKPEISGDNHPFAATGKKGKNLLAVKIRRGAGSWMFFVKTNSLHKADPCLPLTIAADPGKKLGRIKPMNAVNNGPVISSRGIDNLKLYQEAKIPYARNHDASFFSN